jgi:hypothetical protein
MPREAASPGEFACGCWFAPGSTMLFRKELFERIGPFDAKLPRLEDYDWFMRFALAGGRLKVWDAAAAVVRPRGYAGLRCIGKSGLKRGRKPVVIRIEQGDPFATGGRNAGIACDAGAAVDLVPDKANICGLQRRRGHAKRRI